MVQGADRDRRRGAPHAGVDKTHHIDLAGVLIHANRSVKTWSEQINERFTVAYTGLRDIRHAADTVGTRGTPMFESWNIIQPSITTMEEFLWKLIDKFAGTHADGGA